jgi:hypothetical protein
MIQISTFVNKEISKSIQWLKDFHTLIPMKLEYYSPFSGYLNIVPSRMYCSTLCFPNTANWFFQVCFHCREQQREEPGAAGPIHQEACQVHQAVIVLVKNNCKLRSMLDTSRRMRVTTGSKTYTVHQEVWQVHQKACQIQPEICQIL